MKIDSNEEENLERVKKVFQDILELLPHTGDYKIWSKDSEEILCDTEQLCEHLADFVDALYGGPVANTGYYDPEEDRRNGEVDERTGWYYVTVN